MIKVAFRTLCASIAAYSLVGCAVADMNSARSEYRTSVAVYKACLRTGAPCKAEKAMVDADAAAYRAMSRAIRPGTMVEIE